MFESTILLKLWYWVASNRLSTQRELRLLRFDLAAGHGSPRGVEDLSQLESPLRPAGLSRWERVAWMAAIVILALGIASGGDLRVLRLLGSGGPPFQDVITLQADGNGEQATCWTVRNNSLAVMREIPWLYDGGSIEKTEFVSASESPYRDAKGRTLAFRREPAGLNHRNVIQLIDPVPGTRDVQIFWTTKAQAIREGDVWIYKLGPGNSFNTTVELPTGAQIVSVEPPENSRGVRGDRTTLEFEVSTSPDKLVSYQIKYRLPTPASATSAAG
jgi:hypothetical protein